MSIKSLTPLEGRYGAIAEPLENYFSEWALIKYRLHVEVEWLVAMAENPDFAEIRAFTPEEVSFLRDTVKNFDEPAALKIKEIERTTNHDVKAIEYFLREIMGSMSLADVLEFIHFSCTSEDINNLSYALMLKHGIEDVWLPAANNLIDTVTAMAEAEKEIPMLAHTHGQSASPTTAGKELAVFVYRWQRQLKQIKAQEYLGKFNGAVGNFNAHSIAYPNLDWEAVSRAFVESLGLTFNPLTTQIESHDYVAESFHALTRFNNVLLDFDRDMWLYISLGYFKQKAIAGEVGSSTMPHKINPIDFENSEANLGLSNAVLDHLANKLPISRLQRDLSDSSAQRNMGTGLAHSLIAITYTLKGLRKTDVNRDALAADLNHAWEVLAEAVQTVMRKNGHANSYDKLKAITRGKGISEEDIKNFIESVDLPADDKARLLALTPAAYVGIAPALVKHIK